MQSHCETNTLEAHLLSLRDCPYREREAAFEPIRSSPKTEVHQAWERVRVIQPTPGWELDCFQRVEVLPPAEPIQCERAIVLVLGPGYEQLCEWLLETLLSFGDSPEAHIVLFCVDEAYETLNGLENRVPNLTRIRCRSVEKITPAVKGVIYSLARWVKADVVITLECDMLITGSLQPLWSLIEQAQSSSIMGCAPYSSPDDPELRLMSDEIFRCSMEVSDCEWVTGIADYDTFIWFNGGLLAGKHEAWQKLDSLICSWMPHCALWIEGFTRPYGDEMVMNMAVGQMPDHVTLPPSWNVQSFTWFRQMWFGTKRSPHQVEYAHPNGDAAHILHFTGGARRLMRNVFYELALNALAKRKRKSEETLAI